MLMNEEDRKKDNEITVVTLTGDRPQAFSLCRLWMSRQTRIPDQWIVVDDGKVPIMPTNEMQYVRRQPKSDDPKYTMLLNMRTALPLVVGKKIMIMEDDEWYSFRYVEEMARRLDKYEVVGIARSKYYHLPSGRYLRHSNMDHASLAQTAFRSSFLPEVAKLLEGDNFLDIRIWKKVDKIDKFQSGEKYFAAKEREVGDGQGLLFDDGNGEDGSCLYVGIKGLPGRPGIGVGHRHHGGYLQDTSDRKMLQKWIPGDYQIYLDILAGEN